MPTLVSILSDQLIPNVLFIKQMSCKGDRHIFLSSQKMEEDKKSEILADTLVLSKNDYEVIILEPNRPEIIQDQLIAFDWPEDTEYIVNITGGTKMMSQTTFLFFSQLKAKSSRIFYWPITGATLQQLFPIPKGIQFKSLIQLDLKTYLRAHGFSYKKSEGPTFPFAASDALFEDVVKAGFPEVVPVINQAQSPENSVEEKKFYAGGWFEEWLYGFLKRELHLSNRQIGFNLEIKSRFSKSDRKNDNEIDVAFVYKNRLYIWECKVFYSKGSTSRKITDPIYKVASIGHNLGLQATSFVAIMTPTGRAKPRMNFLKDISRLMNVRKVFSMEDMRNKNLFVNEIKKMIDYE